MKKQANMVFAYIAWIIIQAILLVLFQDVYQGTDPLRAIENAQYCFDNGVLFPNEHNLHDLFIQAPGHVYILYLIYAVFGTMAAAQWMNLLMNSIILLEIFIIAKHFYSERVASIACVLYGLIPSNLFVSIYLLSEVPFLFFSLSGFILSMSDKKRSILLAGVMYAIAYTIKPLVLAFAISSIVMHIISSKKWKNCIVMCLPFILFLQCFGVLTEHSVGHKVITSTTGGYNLAMSTENATPCHDRYRDSTFCGYIKDEYKLTFAEKDSILKEAAINYIINHPLSYIKASLQKPFWLFYFDTWSIPSLWDYDNWDYAANAEDPHKAHRIVHLVHDIYSLPYYIIMLLFIVSLFKKRTSILTPRSYLLLIAILGIGATCIFVVEHRYHYPYLFVFTIWAASIFENVKQKPIQ